MEVCDSFEIQGVLDEVLRLKLLRKENDEAQLKKFFNVLKQLQINIPKLWNKCSSM